MSPKKSLSKIERRNFYNSVAWKLKRHEILDRDSYECQWCKEKGLVTTQFNSILEIDHIKELETHPGLAMDNDNLRTLCKDCHNKRHKRFNYRSYGKKVNKWAEDEWFG